MSAKQREIEIMSATVRGEEKGFKQGEISMLKKAEQLVEERIKVHRGKTLAPCSDTCWCWELEGILCELQKLTDLKGKEREE